MARTRRDGVGMAFAVSRALLDAIGPLQGRRFLDARCGSGHALRLAADRGATVWGLDPSVPRLGTARRRVPEADLRVGELDDLPFDSGTFDVVGWLTAGGDHDPVAIRELVRVCRAGGVLGIATPVTGREPTIGALAELGTSIGRATVVPRLHVCTVVATKRPRR